MKIERGKFYRSRDGRKWEVLTTERRHERSVVCMSGAEVSLLHQNGCYYTDKLISNYDLIEEWTEPVIIPWDDYPKWCRWVAMDSGGEWNGYEERPLQEKDYWDYEGFGILIPIHPDYYPKNFTGDWTESLFERPNN
jgi:hypothetical protein